jgi:acyl-CoA hydrolase
VKPANNELIGKVKTIGSSSLKIEVDVFVEETYREHRGKAVSGAFTFVALDERRKPAKILMEPAEEITQSNG